LNILPNEKDLIIGLLKNDNRSVSKIYKETYPLIHSLIINNNGDADDVKDVLQESIVVLFEKAKEPEFELTCKISTYIYSVARRIWLKKLQLAAKKTTIADHIEETVAVEDDLEQHQTTNLQLTYMHDALIKIGEPCKSLLEGYYFNKQNMQDLALKFGYTNAENAKNQKYKCLVRLKKMFFAQYKND
jgi:RNA polymerase sigma factor (sigma-70 family)